MTQPENLPRYRFIPFRRADILRMIDGTLDLDAERRARLAAAASRIEQEYRREFHDIRQRLKDLYAPIDPDADTRSLQFERKDNASGALAQELEQLLDRANYEKVSGAQLQRALKKSSLFQISLKVDTQDFDDMVLYTRGASAREETLRELFGLWKRRVAFVNYDRVVLYLRLKDELDQTGTLAECTPGSTMLKLFQNVPEADLEMLFPNIRIGMRMMDRLLIGVPAVVSGAVVFTTKLGTTLVLIGSLIGFWIGASSQPVELDRKAVLALLAGLGALVGYLWKQFSNFRNRKLKYTQSLTENLYFKLLDTNAGVLLRVLDDAEDSEVKESLIAYALLLNANEGLSGKALDDLIEAWFARHWQCQLDFEIDDALGKLEKLSLARQDGGTWHLID